jgi:hypothetical protein
LLTEQDKLNAAEALARFAKLRDSEAAYFRKRYPRFAPDAWWEYQPNATKTVSKAEIEKVMDSPALAHLPPSLRGDAARLSVGVTQATEGHALPKQWLITQGRVRAVWDDWSEKKDVNLSRLVQLLASVFDPSALTEILYASERRPTYADVTELDKKWDFHNAVEFIAGSPWRAKTCQNPRTNCRRRFIANSDKAKFCSDACINDGRRETVLENFRRHKRKYRPLKKAKRKRTK